MPVHSSDDDNAFSDDDNDFENAVEEVLAQRSLNQTNLPVYEEINNNKIIEIRNQQDAEITYNLNYDHLDTIIYPTNFPLREYQYDIVMKSLFENTLCAIPTGLGKTFIAATVMLNFCNWTNDKMKIIFMAPTKPLVTQQIRAFVQISGISMIKTDILLDKLKKNRKQIWDSKKIFFTTPQVVENDLKTGLLDPNHIALLIVDEAHRATGNYSYTNVIQFINRFHKKFRVLALTATPGADMESIQNVIKNLNISRIEIKTESDPSIKKYIKDKIIEKLDCQQNPEISEIVQLLSDAINPVLEKANQMGIYDIRDPSKINHFLAMEKSQKIINNKNLSEGLKWSQYFILQLLGTVGMALRRLNIYGVRIFYNYFIEKYNEFTTKWSNKKSTNKLAASFYYHDNIKYLMNYVDKLIADDKEKAIKDKSHIEGVFSHTKLQYLVDELICFFTKADISTTANSTSSCIIFTEIRESALEIVRVLENANRAVGKDLIRPHIFIGQSREKDKFDKETYLDKITPKRKRAKDKAAAAAAATAEGEGEADAPTKQRTSERMGSSELAHSKGMNQKSQKELIDNFKSGHYNVLVATSIGEEGLDIGEVDLIVCFDSTQSPIKNIQRMGRTGRKRDGRVLLLFSSNERNKFEHAMGKYEWIQEQIANSGSSGSSNNNNALKFFDPKYNRIVPDSIHPVVEKRYIEPPEENKQLLDEADIADDDEFLRLATQTVTGKVKGKSGGKSKAKSRRKNVDDPKQMKLEKKFFMPKNVETGFRPVSTFVRRVDEMAASPPQPQPSANISIDLTVDCEDANCADGASGSDSDEISIVKVVNTSTDAIPAATATFSKDINGNVSKDRVEIAFSDFSDDDDDLPASFHESAAPRENASFSSDAFSDDIDDDELIALIEKTEKRRRESSGSSGSSGSVDDKSLQRPAKR